MHTATWLAFHDELEKLAVSEKWVMRKAFNAAKKNPVGLGSRLDRLTSKTGISPQAHLKRTLAADAAVQGRIAAEHGPKTKKAGLGAGALDVAGLGMLAAPTVQKMRGKPMSDKNKDRTELAGLGVLGGSVAAEHAHDAKKFVASKLPKAQALASRGFQNLKGLASRIHPK